jgi:uncharacterized membrane protein
MVQTSGTNIMSSTNKRERNLTYQISLGLPPKNCLRVTAWHSLPDSTKAERYLVTKPNAPQHIIKVKDRAQQVLDGRTVQPIKITSKARVSHFRNILRREKCVGIHTESYKQADGTARKTYGCYFLMDTVERMGADEVVS